MNIACLWIYIVSSPDFNYKDVDHKFMLSGHSYLPNDRDFGTIEKKNRKTQVVYVPDVWCTLVEEARRKNPFEAIRMSHDVRSQIVYRKVNTKGDKVDWLSISMATNLPREAI